MEMLEQIADAFVPILCLLLICVLFPHNVFTSCTCSKLAFFRL